MQANEGIQKDSIIKLTFNSESKSKNIRTIKRLAAQSNAYQHEEDESLLVVDVKREDINNNFRSLVNYVIDLKGTTVELNDELLDIKELKIFKKIINCHHLEYIGCDGICVWMLSRPRGFEYIFNAIGVLGEEAKKYYNEFPVGMDNPDFIVEKTGNKVLIDKNKLLERFLDATKWESQLCYKYNLELTKKKFDELPNPVSGILHDNDIEAQSDIEQFYDAEEWKATNQDFATRLSNEFEKKLTEFGDELEQKFRKVLDEYFKQKE